MSKSDGGPAFPRSSVPGSVLKSQDGMTLRDWFAGQILTNEWVTLPPTMSEMNALFPGGEINITNAQVIARRAYQFADDMIAERDK